MKHDDTMGGEGIRLLTKAEACRKLGVSLSTLNRRIAAGEVPVRREPRGRRHRVRVILDDNTPSVVEASQSELSVAQERIRDLEEQVALLQGQLELEQERNSELVDELKTSRVRGKWIPRWRFRRRKG